MINWIKTHRRHTWELVGGVMIAAGVLMLISYSPYTLIVLGVLILIGVFMSLIPDDPRFK